MIPVWLSNTTLAVLLIVCVSLIAAGYLSDRRQAIAAAKRRHPAYRNQSGA